MMRIAVDMDDVIADTTNRYLELYNQEFATAPEPLGRTPLQELAPEPHLQKLQSYLSDPRFFTSLKAVADSVRVVCRLSQQFEVFIATAAMHYPESFGSRFDWLRTHFPFVPPKHIVFCGDKGILNADYLIDDNVWQLGRFRGEPILFTTPYNLNAEGFRRVRNWREVEELFFPQYPCM